MIINQLRYRNFIDLHLCIYNKKFDLKLKNEIFMINAILIINQLQCSIFNEWQIIFNSMACIKLVRSEIM